VAGAIFAPESSQPANGNGTAIYYFTATALLTPNNLVQPVGMIVFIARVIRKCWREFISALRQKR
jgi:hypothetical protein